MRAPGSRLGGGPAGALLRVEGAPLLEGLGRGHVGEPRGEAGGRVVGAAPGGAPDESSSSMTSAWRNIAAR